MGMGMPSFASKPCPYRRSMTPNRQSVIRANIRWANTSQANPRRRTQGSPLRWVCIRQRRHGGVGLSWWKSWWNWSGPTFNVSRVSGG